MPGLNEDLRYYPGAPFPDIQLSEIPFLNCTFLVNFVVRDATSSANKRSPESSYRFIFIRMICTITRTLCGT